MLTRTGRVETTSRLYNTEQESRNPWSAHLRIHSCTSSGQLEGICLLRVQQSRILSANMELWGARLEPLQADLDSNSIDLLHNLFVSSICKYTKRPATSRFLPISKTTTNFQHNHQLRRFNTLRDLKEPFPMQFTLPQSLHHQSINQTIATTT